MILTGNSLALPLADDSVDAVICDPPYGLSFMGRDWDKAVPSVELWIEVLRVLKPGAFAAILCTPRQDCQAEMITRLAAAGFDVGFTSILWTYATGFPKAANLSKLADKRAVVSCPDCDGQGTVTSTAPTPADEDEDGEVTEWDCEPLEIPCDRCKGSGKVKGAEREIVGPRIRVDGKAPGKVFSGYGMAPGLLPIDITAPATPEAKALEGAYAGYQPKPAFEPVLICMKPLSEKTYLDQALANGKGCTWLDDGRIPTGEAWSVYSGRKGKSHGQLYGESGKYRSDSHNAGRFPANVLCCDDVLNDGRVSRGASSNSHKSNGLVYDLGCRPTETTPGHNDAGSYSRYFDLDAWWTERVAQLPESVRRVFPWLIVAKPSKREKNAGCEERKNGHVSVKPVRLMSYLVTLFSRPGGTVLDPFVGSGSTGVAAEIMDRQFVGVELDPEYAQIAGYRTRWAERHDGATMAFELQPPPATSEPDPRQVDLFGECEDGCGANGSATIGPPVESGADSGG